MSYYVNQDDLAAKTESWLAEIAPFNTHRFKLETAKSALLIIDMQKFFLNPQSPSFTCGGKAIIPNLQKLLAEFRKKRRPVIYTCHVHHPSGCDAGIMKWWWEGMCLEGSAESEVCEELAPAAGEKIIYKHRYSAFYNTDLETVLRCLVVQDLVIGGIMTNMCCESTAREAYYRDYRVFFSADGTGSINEEMHLASLLNLAFGFANIVKCGDIIAQLKA